MAQLGSVLGIVRAHEKIFSPECEKTFDVQMIMIIIERNQSRDWLVTQKP
jgi:K+/H+ antiporter YhaU regulatory subunit KhtT